MAARTNTRKALFQTPSGNSGEETTSGVNINVANVLFNLDIAEKSVASVHAENEFRNQEKDAHKERMAKLRQLLIEIEEDNWKYENISKLIGI
jgi:DNA-directed RNA polymerase specialized sigma24 family protein